jgi:hypothetical protein
MRNAAFNQYSLFRDFIVSTTIRTGQNPVSHLAILLLQWIIRIFPRFQAAFDGMSLVPIFSKEERRTDARFCIRSGSIGQNVLVFR